MRLDSRLLKCARDWTSTKLPDDEKLQLECRLTRSRQGRKRRSPSSLDLIACDEIDFLRGDYLDFQRAIVKAHSSMAESYVRAILNPTLRGTEAESKLLFWRNGYYPPPGSTEIPKVYNIRRYVDLTLPPP